MLVNEIMNILLLFLRKAFKIPQKFPKKNRAAAAQFRAVLQ